MNNAWQNGLLMFDEAIRQGHEAVLIDQLEPLQVIEDGLKAFQPDWVLITGSRKPILLYSVARKYGKVAVWDADAVNPKRIEQWKAIGSFVNLAISSQSTVRDDLIKMGIPATWIPQYFPEKTLEPIFSRLSGKVFDLCFFGHAGGRHRQDWTTKLAKMYNCDFGGCTNPKSTIQGRELAKRYANAKIAIGLDWGKEYFYRPYQSDRIFKAMGCGAFFLTYNTPSLSKLFLPGLHLDVYEPDDFDGLVHKIDWYLNQDPESREQIAAYGQEEVMKKHTLKIRLGQYYKAMAAA